MDKPKQRRRSRFAAIPSETRLLHLRPTNAACWDGTHGRHRHEYTEVKYGQQECLWCGKRLRMEPL